MGCIILSERLRLARKEISDSELKLYDIEIYAPYLFESFNRTINSYIDNIKEVYPTHYDSLIKENKIWMLPMSLLISELEAEICYVHWWAKGGKFLAIDNYLLPDGKLCNYQVCKREI